MGKILLLLAAVVVVATIALIPLEKTPDQRKYLLYFGMLLIFIYIVLVIRKLFHLKKTAKLQKKELEERDARAANTMEFKTMVKGDSNPSIDYGLYDQGAVALSGIGTSAKTVNSIRTGSSSFIDTTIYLPPSSSAGQAGQGALSARLTLSIAGSTIAKYMVTETGDVVMTHMSNSTGTIYASVNPTIESASEEKSDGEKK